MAANAGDVKSVVSKTKKKHNPADNFKGKPGPGRPKGVPNSVTYGTRQLFTKLVDMNLDNATKWLERVAKKDPARAFELLMRASEFVLPRMTRMENTGANGAALPPGVAPSVVNVAQLVVSKDDGLALYKEMMQSAAAVPRQLEGPGLPADSRLADGEGSVVAG
jgi:hypothetical protein